MQQSHATHIVAHPDQARHVSGRRWAGRLAMVVLMSLGGVLPAQAATPASVAPDFTLRATQGPNLRLQEMRGKVVMINFWASWCGPCRQEMPHLNRLADKYARSGFVLLGVNVDDDPRKAAAVASELGIHFPVLLDSDKKVSDLYQLQAMPSTFLIDRDGKLRHLHRGYQTGYEMLYEQQIRELLK